MTGHATRPLDLRIGRFVAWFAFLWMIGGMTLLLVVPPIARLNSCTSDSQPCTSWAFTGAPWWWAMLWSVSLIAAIAVCWRPRRWWTPQDRSGRPKLPGVFSTPEWLRAHALIAAIVPLGPMLNYEPTTADLIGLAASMVVALIGVAAATVCIRRTADIIPKSLHRGIAQGYEFWLLPSEHRLRARYGGPPAAAARSASVRADSARVLTGATVSYAAWCFAILGGLPIVVATVVLLITQPTAQPGSYTLLFILAWVPWALTLALLVTFLSGIRYPMEGRRGGVRARMLGLLALCAVATVWYLVVATPYFGGFTWGFEVLLVVQAVLAVAIIVRMLVGRRARTAVRASRR